MAKFLKNFLVFFSVGLVMFFLLAAAFVQVKDIHIKDIPAPNLSDSYSYNEKLMFIRKKNISPAVIGLGSSMTLNNLNSDVVVEKMKSSSYINTGSWGMTVKDSYLLLKKFIDLNTVSSVVMVTNIMDFEVRDKIVKYNFLDDYLFTRKYSDWEMAFETFSLRYYLSNITAAHQVRNNKHDYIYLGYDDYGGVGLEKEHFHIDSNRWNADLFLTKRPYQYSYLDSITQCCKNKNVKLIVFQSPVREGMFSKFTAEQKKDWNGHISKVEQIVKGRGGIFVNATDRKWVDSLFIDATHFGAYGAKVFTKYCFDKIK